MSRSSIIKFIIFYIKSFTVENCNILLCKMLQTETTKKYLAFGVARFTLIRTPTCIEK